MCCYGVKRSAECRDAGLNFWGIRLICAGLWGFEMENGFERIGAEANKLGIQKFINLLSPTNRQLFTNGLSPLVLG